MSQIFRAFETEVDTKGRELLGVAFRYDVPSRVSDDGITTYLEAYRSSAGEGQGPVGLHLAHPSVSLPGLEPRTEEALGLVEFTPMSDHLAFRAVVNDDELGNAYLKMFEAGAFSRGVSIGANILATEESRNIKYRTKIKIFELSTLMNGQRPALSGAGITVVRTAINQIPSKLLRHRLRVALLD